MEQNLLYEVASCHLVKTVVSLVMEPKQTTAAPYTRSPCFTPRLVYDLFSLTPIRKPDIHGSVHQDIVYENDRQDATVRYNLLSLIALHVSSDIFAHHQELLNYIFTASGNTYVRYCLPVSWEN